MTVTLWQRTQQRKSENRNGNLNCFLIILSFLVFFWIYVVELIFPFSPPLPQKKRAVAFPMRRDTLSHSIPVEMGKVGKTVAVYSAPSAGCCNRWPSSDVTGVKCEAHLQECCKIPAAEQREDDVERTHAFFSIILTITL